MGDTLLETLDVAVDSGVPGSAAMLLPGVDDEPGENTTRALWM